MRKTELKEIVHKYNFGEKDLSRVTDVEGLLLKAKNEGWILLYIEWDSYGTHFFLTREKR